MDFSSLNPFTSNALNLAARNNDVKSVERLLTKINPNCIDNRGWTCLHEAAASDSYESLLMILKHHSTRTLAESHEGHTALYIACRYSRSISIIEALLKSVPDIANYGSTEEVTPLHITSAQGRIDVLHMLIQYGAMLDVQDFDGDTPLHDAASTSQHEAVVSLLYAGADPEIRNQSQYTPFHLSCYKGCIEVVKALFPFVNDVNQVVTCTGDTPLILSTQSGSEEVVRFLLENGADPHIKNERGDLALTMALHVGHSPIFKTLLTVTDVDKIEYDLVLKACKPIYFKLDILESLLLNISFGPEFFHCYEQCNVIVEVLGDYRPSYLASSLLNWYLSVCEYIYNLSPNKFREMFYLFLMRGVDVDAVNRNECPPIVYIQYCSHKNSFPEVFKILLAHGCNVDYSSVLSPPRSQQYIPDAFLASITCDPEVAPIMFTCSLYCDPEFLLKFTKKHGVIGRIPKHVQDHLLKLIGINYKAISAENLLYVVLPLQHLCRQKIRSNIRHLGDSINTTDYLKIINQLNLPPLLKQFVRYA